MKILISDGAAGFCVSDNALHAMGIPTLDEKIEMLKNMSTSDYLDWDASFPSEESLRSNLEFILLAEENGLEWAGGEDSYLHVVEIPDEATDYVIEAYDGPEWVIYVLDGKLYYAT